MSESRKPITEKERAVLARLRIMALDEGFVSPAVRAERYRIAEWIEQTLSEGWLLGSRCRASRDEEVTMSEYDGCPKWLLDLVREFSPKVVPLDVTADGTYSEADTRWGLNPVWAAVPRELRRRATVGADASALACWDSLEPR